MMLIRSALRLACAVALLTVTAPATAGAKIGVGDQAPEVVLPDWDGHSVDLKAWRGKVVVLDFWASWCLVCREALPVLEGVGRRFADMPVVVVGVNIDKSRAPAERFLAEHLPAPRMLLLWDSEAQMLARFGAEGMPAVYVIDPNGIVRLAESGYTPGREAAVERVIRQYLPQALGPERQDAPWP